MPYSRFNKEKLTLRDELAIDRTKLANERTLMSYVRLGITLVIAGITIINLSKVNWFSVFGIICIPIGIGIGIIGMVRYKKMNKHITKARAMK
jgi:putative membrane protein